MRDLIVQVMARLLIPVIQVYGIYIVLHGHISPGGGFAGGSVMASSLILYILAFGVKAEEKRLPEPIARFLETFGAMFYVIIGLVGIFAGKAILTNAEAGFILGTPGRLLSSGAIALLTLAIGMKVFSTMVTLFAHLIEDEKEGEEEVSG